MISFSIISDRISQLEAASQSETKCQDGTASFHHEECAKSQCSETITINFNPHFIKAPILMYGLSFLDVYEDHNLRVEVSLVQIATNAATLKVRTWDDTVIERSQVRWMACPQ